MHLLNRWRAPNKKKNNVPGAPSVHTNLFTSALSVCSNFLKPTCFSSLIKITYNHLEQVLSLPFQCAQKAPEICWKPPTKACRHGCVCYVCLYIAHLYLHRCSNFKVYVSSLRLHHQTEILKMFSELRQGACVHLQGTPYSRADALMRCLMLPDDLRSWEHINETA